MNELLPKIALVFPGVGSQHHLMCKSFYDNSRIAKDTFEEASDILKINMQNICFLRDYAQELNKVDIAQIASVTASMAVFRVFEQEIGIEPDYLLGHSLGEYSALCASGSMSFTNTLNLVKERGQIIKEVSVKIDGTMIWIINLEKDIVKDVCESFSRMGKNVYISAYDSPTQCSVSGNTNDVMMIAKILEKKGAIVYPLKISGPFHSPLMIETVSKMREVLGKYKFKSPKYEVIANCNALPYLNKEHIVDNLANQLVSAVRWQESIDYIKNVNVNAVIEIGPKDILKFLIKKNVPDMNVYSFNNYAQINDIKKKFIVTREDRLSIIGKCLNIAISVKNYNNDHKNYFNEIVLPYKEIEFLYEELHNNRQLPNINHLEKAIKMVYAVLDSKKVPEEIIEKKLHQIFEGKILDKEYLSKNIILK